MIDALALLREERCMKALYLVVIGLWACSKPGPAVRLVLLGDTGTADEAQRSVAAEVAGTCADLGCDGVLLLGDNFYGSGVASPDDPLWKTAFEDPYANVAGPFFAVLGNHDYGGGGVGYEQDRAAAQVAVGKSGGKFVLPERFYSHRIGDVDFFALDTPAIIFGDLLEQKKAVREWLASSRGRWRVVYGHHPFWSSGVHGDAGAFDGFQPSVSFAGDEWKTFFEEELCGKVDFYVSGHDHDLEWLEPAEKCPGTELVVSGGGGAAVRASAERHPVRYLKSTHGFFWLEFEGQRATGKVVEAGQAPVTVFERKK
jgi:tartrate-resistant acid phosphatase type 5